MSWIIINQILGQAAIDEEFAQALLREPLRAVQERGYQLTDEEQQVLSMISASNLQEFSQHLLQALKRSDP